MVFLSIFTVLATLLYNLHDSKTSGHKGIQCTLEKLKWRYYWLQKRKDCLQLCVQFSRFQQGKLAKLLMMQNSRSAVHTFQFGFHQRATSSKGKYVPYYHEQIQRAHRVASMQRHHQCRGHHQSFPMALVVVCLMQFSGSFHPKSDRQAKICNRLIFNIHKCCRTNGNNRTPLVPRSSKTKRMPYKLLTTCTTRKIYATCHFDI